MNIDATGVLRDTDGRIPPCPKCGKRWEYEIGPGKAGHHASAKCIACGHFWWLPKPGKRKNREAKHTDLVSKWSPGYCQLCGILVDHVPRWESLEAHHVVEYQSGGEATKENTWIVCTACHRLIHWRRTYVKHLIPNGVANVDSEERPAVDAKHGELDSVEDGQPQWGQADEGADPPHGIDGEFDGHGDMDEF